MDTSGFYALVVKKDHMHLRARDILQEASRERALFVTSDYVLDETATLLNARGYAHLLPGFSRRWGTPGYASWNGWIPAVSLRRSRSS